AAVVGQVIWSKDPDCGMIDLLWFRSNGSADASNRLVGNYWQVRGAGDLNGDGHTEIVTQSHDGQIDLLTDRLFRGPMAQQEHRRVGRIVELHELPRRLAAAPDLNGVATLDRGR